MTDIALLFEQYYNKTASISQRRELMELIAAGEKDQEIALLIKKAWEQASIHQPIYSSSQSDQIFKNILTGTHASSVPHIHLINRIWFRYAAAIITIVTGAAIWYTQQNHSKSFNPLNPSSRQATIVPGHDRAILTLANGQQIILDSTQGNIVKQGSLTVVNLAGKLKYEGMGATTDYNTISTPKGGQYQIVLPDGSKVWLNAASSIRFPTAFTSNIRQVEMTGEAYMEIIKNPKQSFVVKTNGTTIQVLGTSFNVNAYPDEAAVKTTLLEGSVKINNTQLKPGEAYYNGKVVTANIDQDIAWKNGLFNFNNADLASILRQLSRWYDVEVVYAGNVSKREKYVGEVQRSLNLSDVLYILEKSQVHFKIEGKKLIVLP